VPLGPAAAGEAVPLRPAAAGEAAAAAAAGEAVRLRTAAAGEAAAAAGEAAAAAGEAAAAAGEAVRPQTKRRRRQQPAGEETGRWRRARTAIVRAAPRLKQAVARRRLVTAELVAARQHERPAAAVAEQRP
jgi:hypothetical protein